MQGRKKTNHHVVSTFFYTSLKRYSQNHSIGVSNSKRKRLSQPPKGHPANYIKVLFYTITPHVQRAAGVRVIGVCVHMHACMCADTK